MTIAVDLGRKATKQTNKQTDFTKRQNSGWSNITITNIDYAFWYGKTSLFLNIMKLISAMLCLGNLLLTVNEIDTCLNDLCTCK